MEYTIDIILPYLNVEEAKKLCCCCSEKYGIHKIKVDIIESWWYKYYTIDWIKKVHSYLYVRYINKKFKSITCKICRQNVLSHCIIIHGKLIFCCEMCFASIQIDLAYERYKVYDPLFTTYTRGNIHLHTLDIEEYDNVFWNIPDNNRLA